MLGLIPIVLLVATLCGAFYYWLSRRGLAAEERENPQDRRRVSLLTESVGYFGAILVVAGGGVAVGQTWADFTDWGHVGIFGCTAMFFLAIGLVVLRIAEPAIERMIGVVWFVSTAYAGAAAAVAAHDVFGTSGVITSLTTGIAITLYSAMLWLVRRRELQMMSLFAGLTITVCAAIITIAGSAGPRLAVALGLWAFGIGWVIVGRQYPEPLWTTVPLATVVTLIGPAFAVWDHGWVFAVGIMTAAVAMAASIWVRSTTLLAAGTFALFGYITSMVVRYFHQSLGLPATLAVCGVLLLAVAVIMALVQRAAELHQAEDASAVARLRLAGREAGRREAVQRGPEHRAIRPEHRAIAPEHEQIESEPEQEAIEPEPEQGHEHEHATINHTRRDIRSESPTLHLPKAS